MYTEMPWKLGSRKDFGIGEGLRAELHGLVNIAIFITQIFREILGTPTMVDIHNSDLTSLPASYRDSRFDISMGRLTAGLAGT